MIPKVRKIGQFTVTYFNKEELKNLENEIFKNEIYSINLNSDNPVIFDLGAHIGLSTLYFKSLYPKSTITCFEPNPNITPLLEENISLNNIGNIKIEEVALGKKDSKKDFYIDSSGYGAFSTASFKKDAWDGSQKSRSIEVKVERLSKYIDRKINLLKMDIEGAEKNVLEELEETDSLRKIENIIIEYHPIKNHKVGKIVNLLEKNSFVLEYRKDGKILKTPQEDLILIVAKKLI
jgi:FkbM family methyltransferase